MQAGKQIVVYVPGQIIGTANGGRKIVNAGSIQSTLCHVVGVFQNAKRAAHVTARAGSNGDQHSILCRFFRSVFLVQQGKTALHGRQAFLG